MCDTAVILAGGLGTRLRPYTVVFPKPLMPLGEYPILEIIVRQLRFFGFRRLVFAVNHQADLIKAYFSSGSRWDLRIDYSLETRPLSTVGPLALIPDLPEQFLLMNGDVLTDLDFRLFYREHLEDGCAFTISAARRSHQVEYGVLHMDDRHRLAGFSEKPVTDYLVSMGIYGVSRSVLSHIPGDTRYGFDNLMRDMLERREQVRVRPFDGYWKDIGRQDDYMAAIDDFERDSERFLRR
jgi:NDP-sugar pyrophosphorylase family protein